MPLTIFFHCHKAGGTTVVDAAINSGLKLPDSHANGNPLGADGQLIDWKTLSEDQTLETLGGFQAQGVEFLCFEFSTPKWGILKKLPGLQLITVLRDPQARAFSNFRMFVLNEPEKRQSVKNFDSFMNNRSLFRSNNFYTRFFTRTGIKAELDDSHLGGAIRNLNGFDAVCILERGNMAERLEPFGFRPEAFGWKNANVHKKKFINFDSDKHGIDITTYPDTASFQRKNALDYALYSYFLHKDLEGAARTETAQTAATPAP
ncbi:hypothetical protein [Gemmobacter nectariphilus]|uniref:hypothetical protein n=1 Tax=Gemmobacter nectariphilus TaxID=220343 RepID=UPI000403799E|nr:hypothetical protein [Gemmobacter nectariphilus]